MSDSNLQAEDAIRNLNEMAILKPIRIDFPSGSMDFDDLLFNTFILFRNFPKTLNKYQNKFKYILVDEYQDTNQVQYMIVNVSPQIMKTSVWWVMMHKIFMLLEVQIFRIF